MSSADTAQMAPSPIIEYFQQMEFSQLNGFPDNFQVKYSLPNPNIPGQNIVQLYTPETSKSAIYVICNGKIRQKYDLPFGDKIIDKFIISQNIVVILIENQIYYLYYHTNFPSLDQLANIETMDLGSFLKTTDGDCISGKFIKDQKTLALAYPGFVLFVNLDSRKVDKVWYECDGLKRVDHVGISDNQFWIICSQTKRLHLLQYLPQAQKFRRVSRSLKSFKNLTALTIIDNSCWMQLADGTYQEYTGILTRPTRVKAFAKNEKSSLYWLDQPTEKRPCPVFARVTPDKHFIISDVNDNEIWNQQVNESSLDLSEIGSFWTNDILLKTADETSNWFIYYRPDVLQQFLKCLSLHQYETAEKLIENHSDDEFEDRYTEYWDQLYNEWLHYTITQLSKENSSKNPDEIVETITQIADKLPYYSGGGVDLDSISQRIKIHSHIILMGWYRCLLERCNREASKAESEGDHSERETYLIACAEIEKKIGLLSTFMMIYDCYSVDDYDEFLNESIMSVCMNFCGEADFESLKTLWERHRPQILELLDRNNLTEILNAFKTVTAKLEDAAHDKIEELLFDEEFGLLDGIIGRIDAAMASVAQWVMKYIVDSNVAIDQALSMASKVNKKIVKLAQQKKISKNTENIIDNELTSQAVTSLRSLQIKLERYSDIMEKLEINFSRAELAKLLAHSSNMELEEINEKKVVIEKLLRTAPFAQIKTIVQEKLKVYIEEYYPSGGIDELLVLFVKEQTQIKEAAVSIPIRQENLVETIKQISSLVLRLDSVCDMVHRFTSDQWCGPLSSLIEEFVQGKLSTEFPPDHEKICNLWKAFTDKIAKDVLSRHGLTIEDIEDEESLTVLLESDTALPEEVSALLEKRSLLETDNSSKKTRRREAYLDLTCLNFTQKDEEIAQRVAEYESKASMDTLQRPTIMGRPAPTLSLAKATQVVAKLDKLSVPGVMMPDLDRINQTLTINENMADSSFANSLVQFQFLSEHPFTPTGVFLDPDNRTHFLTVMVYSQILDSQCIEFSTFSEMVGFVQTSELFEAIRAAIDYSENDDDDRMTCGANRLIFLLRSARFLVSVLEKVRSGDKIEFEPFYECLGMIVKTALWEDSGPEMSDFWKILVEELLPAAYIRIPVENHFGILMMRRVAALLTVFEVKPLCKKIMSVPNVSPYVVTCEDDVKHVKVLLNDLLVKYDILNTGSRFFNIIGKPMAQEMIRYLFGHFMQVNYENQVVKCGLLQLLQDIIINYQYSTISTFQNREYMQFMRENIPDTILKSLWDNACLVDHANAMATLTLTIGQTKHTDQLQALISEKVKQNKIDAKHSSELSHRRNLDLVAITEGLYAGSNCISDQLAEILKHLRTNAEWNLNCLYENFIISDSLSDDHILKAVYNVDKIDSVIRLLRAFTQKNCSKSEERATLFERLLAEYLTYFLSKQELPMDTFKLCAIFNQMTPKQLATTKEALESELFLRVGPYDYELIEKLIVAIREIDATYMDKENRLFFTLKSYKRFSTPGGKERDAFQEHMKRFHEKSTDANSLNISALSKGNEAYRSTTDIEFPTDATERLPFHILRSNACREQILCKEVNEKNGKQLVELFTLLNVDGNKLQTSVLNNIMHRLEYQVDEITTTTEAEQRIIPHMVKIIESDTFDGIGQKLLDHFKPCPAKVAILDTMINRVNSDLNEIIAEISSLKKQLTVDGTDEKRQKEIMKKRDFMKSQGQRLQDTLTNHEKEKTITLVELALMNAKIPKRSLTVPYTKGNRLIQELLLKYGTSDSPMNFELLLNLISKLCKIYGFPKPKLYAKLILHFCDALADMDDGQCDLPCSSENLRNIVIRLISGYSNQECEIMFGKSADELATRVDSSISQQYAFECFIAAGKSEYVRKITGLDRKAISKTLTSLNYTEKIKKLGLTVGKRVLENDLSVTKFIQNWERWDQSLASIDIVTGLLIDYEIERSDFAERCLQSLEKFLPQSQNTLCQFISYVEGLQWGPGLPCLHQIKRNLRYKDVVDLNGEERRNAYAAARSPRSQPPFKKIKAIGFNTAKK